MITTEHEYRITRRWYLLFKTAMNDLIKKGKEVVMQEAAKSQWEELQSQMTAYEASHPEILTRSGEMTIYLDEIRVGDRIDGMGGYVVTDVLIRKNQNNTDLYDVIVVCNDQYGDGTFAGSWDDHEQITRPAPVASKDTDHVDR